MVYHPSAKEVHFFYFSHELLQELLRLDDLRVNFMHPDYFVLEFFWLEDINPAMFFFLIQQSIINISKRVLNTQRYIFLSFFSDFFITVQNRVQIFDDH